MGRLFPGLPDFAEDQRIPDDAAGLSDAQGRWGAMAGICSLGLRLSY